MDALGGGSRKSKPTTSSMPSALSCSTTRQQNTESQSPRGANLTNGQPLFEVKSCQWAVQRIHIQPAWQLQMDAHRLLPAQPAPPTCSTTLPRLERWISGAVVGASAPNASSVNRRNALPGASRPAGWDQRGAAAG